MNSKSIVCILLILCIILFCSRVAFYLIQFDMSNEKSIAISSSLIFFFCTLWHSLFFYLRTCLSIYCTVWQIQTLHRKIGRTQALNFVRLDLYGLFEEKIRSNEKYAMEHIQFLHLFSFWPKDNLRIGIYTFVLC